MSKSMKSLYGFHCLPFLFHTNEGEIPCRDSGDFFKSIQLSLRKGGITCYTDWYLTIDHASKIKNSPVKIELHNHTHTFWFHLKITFQGLSYPPSTPQMALLLVVPEFTKTQNFLLPSKQTTALRTSLKHA